MTNRQQLVTDLRNYLGQPGMQQPGRLPDDARQFLNAVVQHQILLNGRINPQNPADSPHKTNTTTPALAKTGQEYRQVRRGETLSTIARNNGLSVDDMLRFNRDTISNPNAISAGQTYRVLPGKDLEDVAVTAGIESEAGGLPEFARVMQSVQNRARCSGKPIQTLMAEPGQYDARRYLDARRDRIKSAPGWLERRNMAIDAMTGAVVDAPVHKANATFFVATPKLADHAKYKLQTAKDVPNTHNTYEYGTKDSAINKHYMPPPAGKPFPKSPFVNPALQPTRQ